MADLDPVGQMARNPMSVTAKGWFTVEAGALVRGQIRREIEASAWRNGLEITTDESKGLMESVYRFTVTGDSRAVTAFMEAVQTWTKAVEG